MTCFCTTAATRQDELQKAAEEQKRQEEKERLFKLEEEGPIRCKDMAYTVLESADALQQDALAAHRERLEIELEGKNRVLEAERLEAAKHSFSFSCTSGYSLIAKQRF